MSNRPTELLVVGAGPAGLAAAAEATRWGVATTLVDGRRVPGGQYHARRPGRDPLAGLPDELLDGLDPALLELRLEAEAWATFPDPAIGLATGDHSVFLSAEALVLATGAFERAQPFPGWTEPGVLAAGAAQLLVKEHEVVPEGPVVVAGSGPFLLPVAAQLLAAGADVRALVEARPAARLLRLAPSLVFDGPRRREALGYARGLRRVRRIFGATVVRFGDGAVTLSTGATIACDTLCVGHGFLPRTALARQVGCAIGPAGVLVDERLMSSIPRVFAAGELSGVGGAALAAVEGRVAGLEAARLLGRARDSDRRLSSLRRRHGSLRRFADRLWSAYRPLGPLALADAGTIVCRCEGVTLGAIRHAMAEWSPVDGGRAVKSLLRCGMGACQGELCRETVAAALGIVAEHEPIGPRARPPHGSVSVASLARSDGLLGGP